MNQMTKFFFLGLCLLFYANLSYAQPPGGADMTPEERAQRQTDQMVETLALSDAQKEKIYEVNLKYVNKMREARKEKDGDWTAMRETMIALRTEAQEELNKYLTDEQSQKWESVQAERREKRGTRGKRGESRKNNAEEGDKS